jgi:hypothetical protein
VEQGGHVRAVFVDPTGRRHRLVARTAWVLAGLGVAYVALVVLSLLLPPSLSRLAVPGLGPVLPGPAAAPLAQAEGEDDGPAELLTRSPTPARPVPTAVPLRSARPTVGPLPGASAVSTPAPVPSPASTPPTATPSQAATAAPTQPPGQSTAPGQSQPPGQAERSPRPRPTPSRGPR